MNELLGECCSCLLAARECAAVLSGLLNTAWPATLAKLGKGDIIINQSFRRAEMPSASGVFEKAQELYRLVLDALLDVDSVCFFRCGKARLVSH